MASMLTYKCTVDMTLVYAGNKTKEIPSQSILSIVIDHNYINNIMPVIYATLNVTTDIYNLIIRYKNNGKILLHSRMYNAMSSISVYKDKIKDQFVYVVPANYDYREVLQSTNNNVDNSYNKITIGLFSDTLYNYNSQRFNGVYRDTDTDALVSLITSGRDCIIDNLEFRKEYDEILIPPLPTRSKALRYLYNKINFYKSNFLFFMDFDKSYLVKAGLRESNAKNMNTIVFRIDPINTDNSLYEGMVKDKDTNSYIVYMNATDLKITDNELSNKIVTKVVKVGNNRIREKDIESGEKNKFINERVAYSRLSISGDVDESPGLNKQTIPEDSDSLDNYATVITLSKNNIDASLFDLDKVYLVNNYNEGYRKYNGKYSIRSKKEVIVKRGNEYNTITNITLVKTNK